MVRVWWTPAVSLLMESVLTWILCGRTKQKVERSDRQPCVKELHTGHTLAYGKTRMLCL